MKENRLGWFKHTKTANGSTNKESKEHGFQSYGKGGETKKDIEIVVKKKKHLIMVNDVFEN